MADLLRTWVDAGEATLLVNAFQGGLEAGIAAH
jgi:hypothetical protein